MRSLVCFCLLLVSHQAFALFELNFDFSYDKQRYGIDRKNKITDRSYSGAIITYLFSTTALEINFASNEQKQIENEATFIGSGLSITSMQNIVRSEVYGVGFRQAFASRKSTIVPLISLGYAKQFIRDKTDYTIFDSGSATSFTITDNLTKTRVDSVFASFVLQFRFSQRFSINASVKTVFPAFEWNQAKDTLNYLAGFSLIF